MCTHPSLGKIHIAGVRSISQGGVSAAKSEPPVGAATNGDEPVVPEEAGSPGLFDITHAAVELQTLVGYLSHQTTGLQLGDGGLARRLFASLVCLDDVSVVDTKQIEFCPKLGKSELDVLLR